MVSIGGLIAGLEERMIVDNVTRKHDEVRMRYRLDSNTCLDFQNFSTIIGDYVAYHETACTSPGGTYDPTQAVSMAKEILENADRRGGRDVVSFYRDSLEGRNGGLRAVLDILADKLKSDSVERYVRDVFDRHVEPHNFQDKVEIIRQFMDKYEDLFSSIDREHPERYAHNYTDIIRTFVMAMRRNNEIFRRL